MDAHPFRTARSYLSVAPAATWGAITASIAAAVLLVLLLPVVYLAVDHLVWKGVVPSYSGLTEARQQSFRQEWVNTHETEDARSWDERWQEATYGKLKTWVGTDAAEAYQSSTEKAPSGRRLGILSLVAREQSWSDRLLTHVAASFSWTWRPDAIASANTSYLTGLFLIAVVLLMLHALLILAAEYGTAAASLEAGLRLRRAVYAHASRLGSLTVRNDAAKEAADLFTTKIETIQDGLRAWLRGGWGIPIAIVLLLGVLAATNIWVTICFLLTGGLIWLIAGQAAAWYVRDARLAARRSDTRLGQMRESVTLLQLVKCYLMDRFNQTRVERQLTDYSRTEWRRMRGLAFSRPALWSAITLGTACMLYLAGRAVLFGEMSVAGLASKLLAITALIVAVRGWVACRVRIRRASDAAATVSEFLDRRADAGQPIDAEFLQPLTKRLDFVEVSVRESGTGRMRLEEVSFSVPAGTRVAIVATADEATTLLHLFGRFTDPTGGELRIDGKNIRWVTHESLRTQVALVSQANLIFGDTVTNNIGCGDAGFSTPQVIEAAKVAHAHQFVQKLPYGYETLIGDAGHSLRLGERMRIAVARAILRDPALLVIEEPSEMIDEDSKALLDDTFERFRTGRTLIFLTRRESVLRAADQVFVIHKGKLLMAGKHDDLMDNNDHYRRVVVRELAHVSSRNSESPA